MIAAFHFPISPTGYVIIDKTRGVTIQKQRNMLVVVLTAVCGCIVSLCFLLTLEAVVCFSRSVSPNRLQLTYKACDSRRKTCKRFTKMLLMRPHGREPPTAKQSLIFTYLLN